MTKPESNKGPGAGARLGVDIGGTFTDATVVNEATGELRSVKVLTTPGDLSVGFARAVTRAMAEAQVSPESVGTIVHATTVATNAIVEGKAARTAFITTSGFRDMFEIARQIRPRLYDLRVMKPPPLIPRHLCFGVRERLDARGRVLVPLEESDVISVAENIRAAGATAVAVCLLHSYLNPDHELRVGRILAETLPDVSVSLSCEVCPEFREYLRASTTAVNAAVRPIVERYVSKIATRLEGLDVRSDLLIMQSNGGVYRTRSACTNPVYMVESGPAAGVIAAQFAGRILGYDNILSFDMGGTTAKVGLVEGDEPRVTKEYEVGVIAQANVGEGRGSGYPIRTPVIDLVEIGAGGGSIAWVDSGGGLRVGPQAAGADPGPACYGLGGRQPTVTDANLVLGRLNPEYFVGGEMELSPEAARDAIERICARPLGISVVEAALSIVEIANAAMSNALRLVTIERGYDPRTFALIGFGGAGPAHVNRLAAENDIATTIVPPRPGTISALGLLATDLKHDYSATMVHRLEEFPSGEVEAVFATLEKEAVEELRRDGVAASAMELRRLADVRYLGQGYELTVRVEETDLRGDGLPALAARFHDEHDRVRGFSAPGEPVELVAVRVTGIGCISKPELRTIEPSRGSDGRTAITCRRPVYFDDARRAVDCPVYDRALFGATTCVAGPAIVEEPEATTVIYPGYQAVTTELGFLVIARADRLAKRERTARRAKAVKVGG